MKVIQLVWRDPEENLRVEQFDQEKFKLFTEPGWLKLHSKEEGQIVRLIPSARVRIVQYGEMRDESRIVKPSLVPSEEDVFNVGGTQS